MSTFAFIYRTPASSNAAPSSETMNAWYAWFASMGDNVVDRGNPVFDRTTLGKSSTDTVLGGYSLIRADDLESAVALAKGCPALSNGGGVEIGELTIVDGDSA